MSVKTQNYMKSLQTDEHTLDILSLEVNDKTVLLPQFIYSSNKEFNEVIKADMSLEDECKSRYIKEKLRVIQLYSDLLDNGNDDAGVNLMTRLFCDYVRTWDEEEKVAYYYTLNKMFATKNYAASFYLALDWIIHSNKSWENDFTVERGYLLMSNLAEAGDSFAKLFYELGNNYEDIRGMYRIFN